MPISFFREAFNRAAAARRREAEVYITETLMRFDDRTLKSFGTSRQELSRKRGI